MRKLLLVALCTFSLIIAHGQQGDGGTPKGFKFGLPIKDIDAYTFARPDIEALQAEDEMNDKTGNGPWRFGYNHYTNFTLANSGVWTELPDGGKIWQLMVSSAEALTINLTFKDLSIPEGSELYVYSKDRKTVLGKFTEYHTYEGQLGCELIQGNTAIVEYYVPVANTQNYGSLTLCTVTHGYRTNDEFMEKAFGTSGNCNMNVNCPDGAPWANQKRGAVMLVSGSNGFCSGSLINNTQNDGKPYVLTANHCYSNPASWIFRFHWEAAACTNPGSSPTFVSLSGAALRSRRSPSDFCLVEITGGLTGGLIPASYNAYFSGWNNSNTPPTTSVSIHHPDGDIKKISFDDHPAMAVQAMGSSEPASSWQVQWDRNTTTEGGSSGSPLFDQNGRIIGQLWGGGASCSNLTAPDYYGRVYNSWQPSGSNSTNQLKHWLDPNNSNVTFIDGYDPNAVTYTLDAQLAAVVSPSAGASCNTSFTPQVIIKNNGTTTLAQLSIKYKIDNGTEVNYNWAGSLATNATTNVTLPNFTTTAGNHVFKVYTSAPNGGIDQNNSNDTATVNFEVLNPTGLSLPFSESFEGTTFPPSNWQLQNPDNASTWTRTTTAASQGNASARKDNLNNDDAGQVDNLLTPYLDFSNQGNPTLTFKVAYRRYSATYFDSLIVYASSDCGTTWSRVYNKGNQTLATVTGTQTSAFVPTAAQWRLETVDLNAYAGQNKVQIMFQNKSGYGQMLYIDEINITGSSLPVPNFNITDNSPCVNETITLNNTSSSATSYSWNMPGATPNTSTVASPSISYATAGSYTITLTATNANGSQQTQQIVTVNDIPAAPNVSSNSPVINGGTINLNATNVSGASYAWIGPNGFTSSQQNPTISANNNTQGQYCVSVTVNGCTSTPACTQVEVLPGTSITENDAFDVNVFPNPTADFLHVIVGNADGKMNITITDMAGKTMYATSFSNNQFSVDMTDYAQGVYLLILQNDKGSVIRKTIKR